MSQPFIVGSQDTLTGTLYDVQGSTSTAIDLTGATVKIRARINRGTTKEWSATPDPDQVSNPGVYSYALLSTDIDQSGSVELQALITVSTKTYISSIVSRDVERAL